MKYTTLVDVHHFKILNGMKMFIWIKDILEKITVNSSGKEGSLKDFKGTQGKSFLTLDKEHHYRVPYKHISHGELINIIKKDYLERMWIRKTQRKKKRYRNATRIILLSIVF